MKLTEKWESLQPSTQIKLLQWIGYPLLFLIFIIPGIIYWSSPVLYNDGRHEWMMWWTIITASTFVAVGIGYFVIYRNIKEAIELAKWRKEHPAPKQ